MSERLSAPRAESAGLRSKDWETRRAAVNAIPMLETLGIELVELESGRARLRMPFADHIIQPAGLIHGGALAALADSAVAQALSTVVPPGTQFTTVELKVNYLRPITEGTVWAEAQLLHVGRRTALGDVDMTNDAGKLVAKSTMTYMLNRPGE